ncbi:complement factor H-like isoform X2 [Apostichopus japonicus]|uniref:complement factor H-like isoform X2 n=1 Tax=Stichopus japonicus TaxID=307972 RepID=UPI003AB6A7C3
MDNSRRNIINLFRIYVILCTSGAFVTAQTCSPTDCGRPPLNSNTSYTPVQTCYASGERIDYVCTGDLGGPPYNLCANGNWGLPAPTCEVFTCQPPAVDENVKVEPLQSIYDAREAVTFSCADGADLIGLSTATCDSQDTWTPATVPICVSVCVAPDIDNGQLNPVNGTFREEDAGQVTCDIGYSMEAGASSLIVCLGNGTWDQVPQCFSSCTIPEISNSNYQSGITQVVHDTSVTVQCTNGYSFNQETTFDVTCSDGNLDSSVGEIPSMCHEDCTKRLAPENGNVTSGNLHGDYVEYSCNTGYYLDGPTSMTCSDGAWNPDESPVCLVVCSPLPLVPNGMVTSANGTLTEGAVAFISCDEGYFLQPEDAYLISCQSDGSWDESPTCVALCSAPVIENGQLTPANVTFKEGDEAFVMCADGYMIEGGLSISCQSDGTWTNISRCVAICSAPEITYGDLSPPNATFTDGDEAMVICDPGYSIEDGSAPTITCQKNGTWTTIPNCREKTCTIPPVENSNVEMGMTINHGENYTIDCNEGYSYDQRTMFTVVCVHSDLDPDGSVPEACYENCQPRLPPSNGEVTPGTLHCQTVEYSCDPGYALDGPSASTCNDGRWRPGPPPSCKVICSAPEITYGDLSPPNATFTDGDEAMVICDPGYSIEDGSAPTITCQKNGTWTTIPNCREKTCTIPPVENSNVEMGMAINHGENYTIDCNEGYSYDQRTMFTVVCVHSDLDPVGSVPEACYENCPPRSPPSNGEVTPGTLHGQTVEYSCDPGYVLNGPSASTCNDGRWRPGPPPSCKAICSAPEITYGDLSPPNATFTEGDEAMVICDPGYSIEDGSAPIITCQKNGTWTTIPNCRGDICTIPPVENSNVEMGMTINHGENYTIDCNEGYSYDQRTMFTVVCLHSDLDPVGSVPEACYENCPPRSPPSNGEVTPGTLHGQTVEYSCDPGYALDGPSASTCNDGRWRPRPRPSCKEFCSIPPVRNSNYPTGANLSDSETVTLVCNEGYSYNQSVTFAATCIDGRLVHEAILPDACYKDCPLRLIGPPNGDVTDGNRHGVTLQYSCYTGFLLEGPPTTTCVDGRWIPSQQPRCLVTCEVPNFTNGILMPTNSTFTEGDVALLKCNDGFVLGGASSPALVCLENGQWDQYPACIAVCQTPVVDNGKVTPTNTTFMEGDQLQVTCNDGYSLEEGFISPSVCLSNGTWNRVPTCTPDAICELPAIPRSNYARGGVLEDGEVVLIECNMGFSYNRQARFLVSCNQGELDPTTVVPQACYLNCMMLMPPINGHVTMNFRHGSTAEYSCDTGYVLNGPSTTTCFNGRWVPFRSPTCEPVPSEEKVSLHCRENVFRIDIPANLLTDQDISSLHLRDESCVGGFDDDGHFIIESHYDQCGTTQELDEENGQVIYRNLVTNTNELSARSRPPPPPSSPVDIEAECVFDQDNQITTNYKLANQLTQSISENGRYNFSFLMYTDDSFSQIRDGPVYVDSDTNLFLKVQLETDVTGLSLIGSRCWATPTEDVNDANFTNLIVDGCASGPNDVDVKYSLLPSEKPAIAFSVSVLQFSKVDRVYIHCNARICEKTSPWACLPSCQRNQRKKRASGLMTSYQVTQGPIFKSSSPVDDDGSGSSRSAMFVSLGASILAVCALFGIMIVSFNRKKSRFDNTENDSFPN